MADEVRVPDVPSPSESPLIRNLTILASGLTAAGVAINLILQVLRFLEKRPVQPDQRDRIQTAGLVLTILRTTPGLVKQVRILISQIRGAA